MSGHGDDSDPMGAETESTLRAMADKAGAAPWSVRSTDIIGRAHRRRRRSREQLVIVLVVAAFVAIFVAPIPQLHLFHRTQSGGRSNIAASSTRPTTTVPVSASPWQPQGVQWLSPSAAYVVETRRCGARSCTRLLLTTDAGRHFNQQPAASTPVASDGLAALPTFANLEDAYRTVGSEGFHYALFQSDDAAQSWHPVTFGKGTTVTGSQLSHNRGLYAVVASCTGVYVCGDYRLYRIHCRLLLLGGATDPRLERPPRVTSWSRCLRPRCMGEPQQWGAGHAAVLLRRWEIVQGRGRGPSRYRLLAGVPRPRRSCG